MLSVQTPPTNATRPVLTRIAGRLFRQATKAAEGLPELRESCRKAADEAAAESRNLDVKTLTASREDLPLYRELAETVIGEARRIERRPEAVEKRIHKLDEKLSILARTMNDEAEDLADPRLQESLESTDAAYRSGRIERKVWLERRRSHITFARAARIQREADERNAVQTNGKTS